MVNQPNFSVFTSKWAGDNVEAYVDETWIDDENSTVDHTWFNNETTWFQSETMESSATEEDNVAESVVEVPHEYDVNNFCESFWDYFMIIDMIIQLQSIM